MLASFVGKMLAPGLRTQAAASRSMSIVTKHNIVNLNPPRPRVVVPRRNLTEEEVQEVIRLRTSDPVQWTQTKLSIKFNTSKEVISETCKCPREYAQYLRLKIEAGSFKWRNKTHYRVRKGIQRKAKLNLKKLEAKGAFSAFTQAPSS
eukprot:TRINITY_DN639_c0_g1_i1.p1 TRINITY_DN639_c0_g1~~TRINITY_DN639_c0_g1_i1.p1  ORF type:complete len:159 (-),score=57.21 TRINITY_DN639_c0_g1_i1:26-469(-)